METKVKILEKLDKGIQEKRLASDFNVSASSINYIKSNRTSILNTVCNAYQEARNKSLGTLTGPILKEKAKQIFREEYPDKMKMNSVQVINGFPNLRNDTVSVF